MFNRFIKSAFALLAFVCFQASAIAQTNAELINALNQQLIPIKVEPADSNFDDLQKLKPLLKDKQVIGLGEATHGTHEFFAFKHRMLMFLVKEMGVKSFVIEADFAGTQQMNDYVVYGKGDVQKGLAGMGFGVWMTQEVVDMANWIKAYNATQLPENKVSFYGCDMQWGTTPIKQLKDYLQPLGQFTPVMDRSVVSFNQYTASLSNQDKQNIKDAVTELSQVKFDEAGIAKAEMYQQYVKQLQQFVAYLDAKSSFFPTRQSDWRDRCMAENCEWIYNYTGHKKMMIWAHNGHINKSSGNHRLNRMGMYLAKTFPNTYYAMGFDFYQGSVRYYDRDLRKSTGADLPPIKPDATGALFAQCSTPNFIIDIKSASANPLLKKYFSAKNPSLFYGGDYTKGRPTSYVTYILKDTFDAIIFIRETIAARDMI